MAPVRVGDPRDVVGATHEATAAALDAAGLLGGRSIMAPHRSGQPRSTSSRPVVGVTVGDGGDLRPGPQDGGEQAGDGQGRDGAAPSRLVPVEHGDEHEDEGDADEDDAERLAELRVMAAIIAAQTRTTRDSLCMSIPEAPPSGAARAHRQPAFHVGLSAMPCQSHRTHATGANRSEMLRRTTSNEVRNGSSGKRVRRSSTAPAIMFACSIASATITRQALSCRAAGTVGSTNDGCRRSITVDVSLRTTTRLERMAAASVSPAVKVAVEQVAERLVVLPCVVEQVAHLRGPRSHGGERGRRWPSSPAMASTSTSWS